MQRIVLQPADLSGAAVSDLKTWLGISRDGEDSRLADLLRASVELCEGFTGQAPLAQLVEERVPPLAGKHRLVSRPMRSFVGVDIVADDGTRAVLPTENYEFCIGAGSTATIHLHHASDGQAVAIRMEVGIAADWQSLPGALKQGILRMAAYHYRDRDADAAGTRDTPPPASVAALWRPWRIVRLA